MMTFRTIVCLALLVGATPASAALTLYSSEPEAQRHCPADTVVWLNLPSGIYHFIRGTLPGYAQTKIVRLYTHPARSGVVSDEDVETACRKYYNCGHPVYPPVFEAMRAALEHFVAIAQEKQS